MIGDLRFRVTESLLDVLCSSAVYVEGCDILSILGLFGTFDSRDIAQLSKLLAIERLVADLEWLILFPPVQRGCELLLSFLEIVDVGSKEFLKDDEGGVRCWLARRKESAGEKI